MDIINTNLPYEGYCASLQGGRPENQDTVGYKDTPYGLLVVICDGMGGGPGGKTASVLAVESILDFVSHFEETEKEGDPKKDRKEILKMAIAHAEQVIIDFQEAHAEYKGMGTTVVALLINSYSAIVAHVGDSRCYQLRWGQKKFRTQDHSFVGDLVRKSRLTEEQARLSSQSNIITRALSGRSNGEPSIYELPYEKGDRFVLCTDGIWGMMPEPELIKYLTKGKNYALIVEKLALDVDAKGRKSGGGHDNLTLALVVTNNDSELKETMSRKYRYLLFSLIAACMISVIVICTQLFIINSKNNDIDKYKRNEKELKQDRDEKDSQIKDLKGIQEDLQDTVETYKQQDKERKVKAEKEKKEKEQKEATQVAKRAEKYKNIVNLMNNLSNRLGNIPQIKSKKKQHAELESIQRNLKNVKREIKNSEIIKDIDFVLNESKKSCMLDPKEGQAKILTSKLNEIIEKLKEEDFL